jgi:transcriptional regulator with XRE-family HTH domain
MADAPHPLRTFRKAQTPALSLKALAERVGLTEGQLSRIERKGTESLTTAMKLSEITGLPVESFARASDPQDAAAR